MILLKNNINIATENEKEYNVGRFCEMYPELLNKSNSSTLVIDGGVGFVEKPLRNDYLLSKEELSAYKFILDAIRPLRMNSRLLKGM